MKKRLLIALLAVFACSVAFAQDVKLSELKLQSDANVMDEYGNHPAWIELTNYTHKTQKVASMYITNDKSNPTMCRIPTGDLRTNIAPKQSLLLYADGQPQLGNMHLNFTIKPGDVIALYAADGIKLIDEVQIPAVLTIYDSYALNDETKVWELRDGFTVATAISPGEANNTVLVNNKVGVFKEFDQYGIILTVLAMAIVFMALILLSICFFLFGRLNARIARGRKAKVQSATSDEELTHRDVESDSSEVIAAIGMALYQHINAHDVEETVLTINKVKRTYSPWSSKIYTLRELPRR